MSAVSDQLDAAAGATNSIWVEIPTGYFALPLDDIADAQNIEFDDLLNEIEAIVYSGTKLNIDYFLEDVMDDDHVDDIYEYFRESDTDDLDTAMDELGGDYSEDEVRLVRIKFFSEMAN